MIGNVIKSIRIANEQSESEFGRCLNVSHAMISQVESGKRGFSMNKIQRISELYNISVSKIQELNELDDKKKLSYMETLKNVLDYYICEQPEMVKAKRKVRGRSRRK